MKKKLVVINGTMGSGKTEISKVLFTSLNNCAWIDGDWCWNVHPYTEISEEDKEKFIQNITNLLNSYLTSKSIEIVIFSWVIPQTEILNTILEKIFVDYQLNWVTLLVSKEELENRIKKRWKYESRDIGEYERSILYMDKFFKNMNSYKLDTSGKEIDFLANHLIDYFKLCEE